MTRRGFALMVLVAVMLSGGWAAAQSGAIYAIRRPVETVDVKPLIVSGQDVGFRIEARRGLTAIGKLVVKVDGAWVDAEFSADGRLTQR